MCHGQCGGRRAAEHEDTEMQMEGRDPRQTKRNQRRGTALSISFEADENICHRFVRIGSLK